MQYKIYELLLQGRNVILSAPTSMGKSAIVDSLIASRKFNKIVIVLPTVALVDETRRRLQERFGGSFQVIHHGTQTLCSERALYVLTQERVNDREDLSDIDLFVLDEFYKLALKRDKNGEIDEDDDRTHALNSALSKLLRYSKQFFMTGPFINGVSGLPPANLNYTFVPSDFNTVALDVIFFNIKPDSIDQKNAALCTTLKEVVGPTIIYCRSPARALKIAKFLTASGYIKSIKDDYIEWLDQNYHPKWEYTHSFKNGIGLHYGGLPRAMQQYVIDKFNRGELPFLICTSTIIEGVNTVAKNVFIYDNRNGNYSIDRFTHGNIKGRAGRMGVHFVGKVFCMEELPKQSDCFEVEIPLGKQNEDLPINFLAGIQPEHLTDFSQSRFEAGASSSRAGKEFLRKHAYFKIETIESAFSFVEMCSDSELQSCNFSGVPKSGFALLLSRFVDRVCSGVLRKLGLINNIEVIHAKISRYLIAPSYGHYLTEQIARIPPDSDSDKLSEQINHELNFATRVFGYAAPKALSLFEDIINLKYEEDEKNYHVSYGYLRSVFENYHLHPAWAGLEEMGIPVQLLHKLGGRFNFINDASVDDASRMLKENFHQLGDLSSLEIHFVNRALGQIKN
nr:DEAD/DEAH box helicase [Pseudomonas sp. MWU12-2037]